MTLNRSTDTLFHDTAVLENRFLRHFRPGGNWKKEADEVPSKEPKTSFLTKFDDKNIIATISVSFGPKNVIFGNILTRKYRTYAPPICANAECPPPGIALRVNSCVAKEISSSSLASSNLFPAQVEIFDKSLRDGSDRQVS